MLMLLWISDNAKMMKLLLLCDPGVRIPNPIQDAVGGWIIQCLNPGYDEASRLRWIVLGRLVIKQLLNLGRSMAWRSAGSKQPGSKATGEKWENHWHLA